MAGRDIDAACAAVWQMHPAAQGAHGTLSAQPAKAGEAALIIPVGAYSVGNSLGFGSAGNMNYGLGLFANGITDYVKCATAVTYDFVVFVYPAKAAVSQVITFTVTSPRGAPVFTHTYRLNRLYEGWWISRGTPSERRIAAASRVFAPSTTRSDVEGLALPDRGGERPHRLLERRVEVEAVRVEDVEVVDAHPAKALVQARQHVLARPAALAVRPRPHVPARLARDDQLVAVRSEVLAKDAPKLRSALP